MVQLLKWPLSGFSTASGKEGTDETEKPTKEQPSPNQTGSTCKASKQSSSTSFPETFCGLAMLFFVFLVSFFEIFSGFSFNSKKDQVIWNKDLNFLVFLCAFSGVGLLLFRKGSSQLTAVGLVGMVETTLIVFSLFIQEVSRAAHEGITISVCKESIFREENKGVCMAITIMYLLLLLILVFDCLFGTVCVYEIWKKQKGISTGILRPDESPVIPEFMIK